MPNTAQKDSFYTSLFARIYDPFMRNMEQRVLSRHRAALLANISGNVLEVGSGTGINFPLYGSDCHVIASEPSGEMLRFAEQRLASTPAKAKITLVQAGIGDAVLNQHVPVNGFDAIVCTLVLCTIPNPAIALQRMHQWLRPGGKLIILEHIHGQSKMRRAFHTMLNPLWKHAAEGCHLTRDTDKLIPKMGFIAQKEDYFTKVLPFYEAVFTKA